MVGSIGISCGKMMCSPAKLIVANHQLGYRDAVATNRFFALAIVFYVRSTPFCYTKRVPVLDSGTPRRRYFALVPVTNWIFPEWVNINRASGSAVLRGTCTGNVKRPMNDEVRS